MRSLGLLGTPVVASAVTETATLRLRKGCSGAWGAQGVEVRIEPGRGAMSVTIQSRKAGLRRVALRWRWTTKPGLRLLGDHWERGYGDLEWRGIVPERVMPWYFLAYDGKRTHGCGVKTGAKALCWWQADSSGITLWLDVRSGGEGVHLGSRALAAAEIVTRQGRPDETPFAAAQAFCRLMASHEKRRQRPATKDTKYSKESEPVYGGNDWYYVYGRNSAESVLEHTDRIVSVAPSGPNRPWSVIDAGWQMCGWTSGGPWRSGNSRFPDMARLAERIRAAGARPGIWIRPLRTAERLDSAWLLPSDRYASKYTGWVLDPSAPEALAHVAADIRRLKEWGYDLIKHDFATFDLFGNWGFQMGSQITPDTWAFADNSRTSAEVVLDLYRAIREAAGDALVIGCNTIGHLAAGLVELQRTGDDTSGLEWERTRKMGVNTLAFRMPQHGAFFACDADCVGLTPKVPWEKNRQWLSVLAESGTPLFVSISPEAFGPAQRKALKEAFAHASRPQPPGEPLDWLDTTCPSRWKLNGRTRRFEWGSED